jgi:hypothetical protein
MARLSVEFNDGGGFEKLLQGGTKEFDQAGADFTYYLAFAVRWPRG